MSRQRKEPLSGSEVRPGRRAPAGTGALLLLAVLLVLAAVVALRSGAYHLDAAQVMRAVLGGASGGPAETPGSELHNIVVWRLRMPRILLAIAVGAALAAAGAVYQGCFRNPLVEPFILGVSSGAAFGAALGIVLPRLFPSIAVTAFVFGTLAVAGAYSLARRRGETPVVTLILAGVIIGSVFSALISILKYLSQDAALREIVFWLMGGFYFATWNDVAVVGPVVAACIGVIWALGWKLNVLSMGDEEARALGVHPEGYKAVLILLATLMTAVSVSTVGIIAWVGLMTPHAVRMMIGPDHRFVIPAAAMLGAIYLIVCDTLARTLTPAEIPVGIITSILGAPYLFYLLRAKGRAVFG